MPSVSLTIWIRCTDSIGQIRFFNFLLVPTDLNVQCAHLQINTSRKRFPNLGAVSTENLYCKEDLLF